MLRRSRMARREQQVDPVRGIEGASPSPPIVPFNRPFIAGKELEYITEAVSSGNISGDGKFTDSCERLLEDRFGIAHVLLTPSCTAALEMAAMLCGIEPG